MGIPSKRRAASPQWPTALSDITDAYLRVSAGSPPIVSPAGQTEALLFVDLDGFSEDVEQLLRSVRDVPAGFLTQAKYVLARIPADGPSNPNRAGHREELAGRLVDNLARRGVSPVGVGVVDFPVSRDPIVVWQHNRGVGDAVERQLLARARRVELATLLTAGRAIWEPTAYHYQLPSGLHAARFVRTADAVQRPRDAVVVASWLYRHLADRLGVVLDSSSTVAISVALSAAATQAGLRPGPVISLDDYPSSQFDVVEAVSRAASEGDALALLSVSSSGQTRDRLTAALTTRGRGVVEVLVDRQGSAANDLEDLGHGWIGLMEPALEGDSCRLCNDADRPLVVQVDPRSFAPHAVSEPTLMVPEIADARDNRGLLELYDRSDSIGLECEPHPVTQQLRPSGNLAFRFYPHSLLDPRNGVDEELRERLRSRIEEGYLARQFGDQPDALQALIVLSVDHAVPGFDALIELIEDALPFTSDSKRVVVDLEHKHVDDFAASLERVEQALVLTVGSMSGVTLSDVNVLVQDHSNARLWGVAIHARPSTAREWETLHNSYSRNLAGAWVTLLPERSLFKEEALSLKFARGLVEPQGAEKLFVERRITRATSSPSEWTTRVETYERAFGADEEPQIPPSPTLIDPYAVFWGMPQQGLPPAALERRSAEVEPELDQWQRDSRIRRGSYYGDRLRAVSVLAAMGPPMQSARELARQEAAPVRRQFDMPSIFRLYFDPLLLAAVLRWCKPDELWWGAANGVSAVLQETVARFEHDDDGRRILVAELLLAAIMGKLPAIGYGALSTMARHESDGLENGDTRSALTWGASVLDRAGSKP